VKKNDYYYSERSYGSFKRSIEILHPAHSDKAHASLKDGVLGDPASQDRRDQAKGSQTKGDMK